MYNLSKRELFILNVRVEECDFDDLSVDGCKERGLPAMPNSANRKRWEEWRFAVEAELRIRRADALLAALSHQACSATETPGRVVSDE